MNRDPAGYSAALYMRLSKDDDCPGESSSITSQRSILTAYAREHGYRICEEYVDGSDKIGLNQQSPYSKGGALI